MWIGHAGRWARTTAGALLLVAAPGFAESPDPPRNDRITSRDALVFLGGLALGGTGKFLLDPDIQDVPASGLDRGTISLDWDRNAVGRPETGARTASDVALGISFIVPSVLEWAGGGDEDRRLARTWITQAQAVSLAYGSTLLLKPITSRPRPFTYLSGSERPEDPAYDPGTRNAFESFPSGHAAIAWASALSGVGLLASERPDLSPGWHFLAGFASGGAATATSLLRVDAGEHFPTDVAAGAALGSVAGVGIVLWRQGPAPDGSRGTAWRNSLLGLLAGSAVAFLVTPPTSPWID